MPVMNASDDAAAVGPPLLNVKGMSVRFRTDRGYVKAVNDVSFRIRRGEIVGIVGESGCGKSATLRAVLGLTRAPGEVYAGKVCLEGRSLLDMRPRDLRAVRGAEIGFVGQSPFAALNPILSIEAQFANVLKAHRRIKRAEIREIALKGLISVGIKNPEGVLGSYAHQLSGGMAQRVVIAIAMCLDPHLLVADEPTTALDVTVQRQILDLIRAIIRTRDAGTLLVTHDLGVVAQYCDWVIVMYAGRVVEEGPTKLVLGAPRHPYTQALLKAIPRPGQTLQGLTGSVPNLIDYPPGCPYTSRCPLAVAACEHGVPPAVEIHPMQKVACIRVGETEPGSHPHATARTGVAA
jgi:peptide/nickel transport system ATP-binding protein